MYQVLFYLYAQKISCLANKNSFADVVARLNSDNMRMLVLLISFVRGCKR
ncbi:hypothetical protein GPAL_3651 [Glaciecola pallidula DSM 14239 = ACAM 615]|uniref:Uncharacterized protein n=1 Tax=Brumicola pallidula DSM 14239 = ACAM 615 TaxID=1121922 RepID=K6ZNN0_9ALTE|nr:hypothetical protein GPAL_3651 [Glaciecola pallidula DSM 14239 = ACAM 615]